jgi:hypothetical protein
VCARDAAPAHVTQVSGGWDGRGSVGDAVLCLCMSRKRIAEMQAELMPVTLFCMGVSMPLRRRHP